MTFLKHLTSLCLVVAVGFGAQAEDYGAGIAKVIRGKTECTDTNNGNRPCGVERWTMYVHNNGQRYLHVVSTSNTFNETRHAMVRVDTDNHVREAFMSNVDGDGILGSTYVVLQGLGAFWLMTTMHLENSPIRSIGRADHARAPWSADSSRPSTLF